MMNKHKIPATALIFLLSFFSRPVPGRTDDRDIYDLDLKQLLQVKVETLNKRPQHFFELPAATTVIDRQEIERSGAQTIPDLLVRVPGVFVKQISSRETVVAIRNDIQMFNTNLLVLIDGNPYYNQTTANVLWSMLPIAVEDIERIEIIRGDGGTTWGTNSSSGVINIITRTPDSEPVARAGVGGGLHAPFRLHAVTSTGFLRLSAHGERDQGWSDDPSTYSNGYISGRYDTNLADWNLNLSGRVFGNLASDVTGGYTGIVDDEKNHGFDSSISLNRTFGEDKFSAKGFIHNYTADFAIAEAPGIQQKLGDVEMRYSHLFAPGHRTQFGVNYRHYLSKIPPQRFLEQRHEKITDSLINLTIDHESRLTDTTTVNLGLRYERFTIVQDNNGLFSSSFRLSHHLNKNTLAWGSYNRSYQFPSYLMTDISGLAAVKDNTYIYQTGNPALNPEKNDSWEIGLRSLLGEGVFLDASTFYGRIRDEIVIDPTELRITQMGPTTRIDQLYTNHIKSTIWGAEMSLGIDVGKALHSDLGLTWFHRHSREQDSIYRGNINDQYAPDYKITLNSRYTFSDALDLSLFFLYEPSHDNNVTTKYSSPRRTDGHFRADGNINYHFSPQGTLSVGFKNLFNSGVEWDVPSIIATPVDVEPSVFFNLRYHW
ncbi:MAG TPA: TonB-dependent receptor [Desulfobulbaceae bacterium]|nr:TonB-dependent receptor [Desulfobulbaceae bacterium]